MERQAIINSKLLAALLPRIYRQRNSVDIRSARLGQLAGGSGISHRTCRERKHRRNNGNPLRRRRHDRLGSYVPGFHRNQRIFIPRFQPALCSVFRCDRRDKTRNEQHEMDLVRYSVSVRIRIRCRTYDQPVRQPVHWQFLGTQRHLHDSSFRMSLRHDLHAFLQEIQRSNKTFR